MADGNTLWHGRFSGDASEALRELNDSLPFDRRMYREDIKGSCAHVEMLHHVGLVTDEELSEILAALEKVAGEISDGSFEWMQSDEDIHTAVERRATELTSAAAKIHTGRSRNDQVAGDLRLVALAEIDSLSSVIFDLIEVLLKRAEEAHKAGIYLPGYTHLQRAQPVGLAHHFGAFCWMFLRDLDRLADVRRRTDVSVLGAGALAGSSLPIDPMFTAQKLGFARVFDNSLDAVSDRDFVSDLLYVLSLTGVHLSKLGEEICLWASSECDFVELADEFATGSSMMPQKGLPLTYNKDLQEDKEPLFDSCDTIRLTTLAMTGLIDTLTFHASVMADSADSPFMAATDLADFLVQNGMAFREAHAVVAGLVREALEDQKPLMDLVKENEQLGDQAAELLLPGVSSQQRTSHGGGASSAVATQLVALRERVDALR